MTTFTKEIDEALDRKDFVLAEKLLNAIADNGSKSALFALGRLYEMGGNGVAQDIEKACCFYERAYSEGKIQQALFQLSSIYFFGTGVPRDYKKAYAYCAKLEAGSNPIVLLRLGAMYEMGLGTETNYDKAMQLYRRASSLGNLDAQIHLAHLEVTRGNLLVGVGLGLLVGMRRIFKSMVQDGPESHFKE